MINPALIQKRPNDPGHLVGQRDCGHLERAPSEQRFQPGARPIIVPGNPQNGCRPEDQENTKFGIAHFRDPAESFLASAGMGPRCQSHPGGEVARRFESAGIWNQSLYGRSGDGADAGDRRQPPRGLVGLGGGFKLPVDRLDCFVERIDLSDERSEGEAHAVGNHDLAVPAGRSSCRLSFFFRARSLHDEEGDKRRVGLDFEKVLVVVREIVDATARLTWITAGYGWISIVAPIVIASPAYFSGRLSFGELMVVVGGFYQVNQSLRWFVDNFALLAEWRAALSRVIKFREVLLMSESGYEDTIPLPFGGVKPVNPAVLRPFRTSAQTSGSL